MFRSKIRRPTKKRKTERCSRVGTASVANRKCTLSVLLKKNSRSRARFCGLPSGWVTLMYRRVHCCNRGASKALVMLMVKLENQREFTQMAYLGGENELSSVPAANLRSWIDTVSNAARAAENKPVYRSCKLTGSGVSNRNEGLQRV